MLGSKLAPGILLRQRVCRLVVEARIVVQRLADRRWKLSSLQLVGLHWPRLLVCACAPAHHFALSELGHLAGGLGGWQILLLLVIFAVELVYRLSYIRLPRLHVARLGLFVQASQILLIVHVPIHGLTANALPLAVS